jgi:hypothetical protein
MKCFYFVLITTVVLSFHVIAQENKSSGNSTTFIGTVNNNWSNPGNWSNGFPDASYVVYIGIGKTCFIDSDAVCLELDFLDDGSSSSTLTINTGTSLTTGTIYMPSGIQTPALNTFNSFTINLYGTLSCDSVILSGRERGCSPECGSTSSHIYLWAASAVMNVTGDIVFDCNLDVFKNGYAHQAPSSGAAVSVYFLAAATLNIGGSFINRGNFTSNFYPDNGTVEYNGNNDQTVYPTFYYYLILNGSGTKTLSSVTINNKLTRSGHAKISQTPSYGAGAILEYTGSSTDTTGPEFPSTMNNTVIISTGDGVVLSENKTINSSMTLQSGRLYTNGDTLFLGSTGSLDESNGFEVVGHVSATRTCTQDVSQNFSGLFLDINAHGNSPGPTTVVRTTGARLSGGGNQSIRRYFDITPTVNTGLNADFEFNFLLSETKTSGVEYVLNKSTDGGTTWTVEGGTYSEIGSMGRITLTGVNDFSLWTATPANAPLPIQLLSFSASSSGNSVTLDWATTSETNNKGYYVERRAESEIEFTELPNSFVEGAGTTLEEQHYSWTDENVSAGTYFYRLRQVDLNGDFTYSHQIQVVVSGVLEVWSNGGLPEEFALEQNYPNPFNPVTVIRYQLPVGQDGIVSYYVTLKVYDMLGQEVATLVNGEQSAGYKSVKFDASRLTSGIYIYKITAGQFTQARKILLTK